MFPSLDSNRTYIYIRFNNTCGALPLIIYSEKYRKVRRERKGETSVLPRKGYKCITVTDKVHEEIKKKANQTNLTIKQYIEYLLAKEQNTKEGK